ncbi:MAG: PorV/PorQ family protein [Bacteroidetes bacterium]|nr:PorV/PorQ family protein [Bacteroidota bacterium]
MRKFLFLALVLFASKIFAQSGEGGEPGAFMKNGFGARASSLGNSFTAIANDVSAIYYNPAGLSTNTQLQVMGMYSNLFGAVSGLNYGNLGVSKGFEFGTVGLGVIYSSVSDIPYVENVSGPSGETFSDNEMALLFSFSRKVTDNLQIGLNTKIIRHSIAGFESTGYGLDVALLSTINDKFSMGLMIQDAIGAKIKLNGREDVYISKFKLGAAYKIIPSLTISPEIFITGNKKLLFSIGSEYDIYKNMIKLRGGYNSIQDAGSAGIGIKYSHVNLDFSYSRNGDLGNVSKFGFILEF